MIQKTSGNPVVHRVLKIGEFCLIYSTNICVNVEKMLKNNLNNF